jgi:peptidoglycan/LPS O-acetylase OafA/YrhL
MHRADIDGLRAVAVISVVLFHFKLFPNYIRGGFIGVDVFFVISGYLITGIILKGINDGSYSVANFYNRRIRRIFPALFAVFGFCILAGFFWYFPAEAATVGASIAASTFFISNIFFYLRSDYFERDSETNPLLHTWSLSVEEQFYVLFPLVVFLIKDRSDRAKIAVISFLMLASFLYAAYAIHTDVSATFYLTHFRAWELLIGALLAAKAFPDISRRWIAEAGAAAGLILLCASFYVISRTSLFPGPIALAPCIGTALIIWTGVGHSTWVGRLLSLRPVQFVGLISYSLYLWHWPMIVFFRLFHEPDRMEKFALVIASTTIAALSWRFIERPFREKPYRFSNRGTLLAGGGSMIAVAVAALLLRPGIEQFWNYPSQATDVIAYAKIDESHMRVGTCFLITSLRADFSGPYKDNCLSLKPDRPNFLVLGDSHAAHLWSGLQSTQATVNFLQATASGCKPIDGAAGLQHCRDLMAYVLETFIPNAHLDGIIISGRWELADLSGLISTVQRLSRHVPRVIVFGPIVEYDQSLPRILAKAIASGRPLSDYATEHRRPAQKEINLTFARALKKEGIEYFSTYEAICNPECLIWAEEGVPLQFDDGHLTRQGSAYVARKFGRQVFSSAAP